jgi:exopolysaccharide production protein ExoQ
MTTAAAPRQATVPYLLRPEPLPHLVLPWVLMCPFIFFAVHGNFSFQNAGQNNALGGTALAGLAGSGRNLGTLGYIVFPGIAYSIVLWLITAHARNVTSQLFRAKTLTLLALLTIVSSLWSQNPFRSFYNGIFYFVDTLFAFYLVTAYEAEEIASLIMMAGLCVSILSLIFVFLFPQFGVLQQLRETGAWRGIFIDRTSAAKCMVFLLSPAIVFRRQSWSLARIAYVALLVSLIFMAHAVTAIIVLFFYVAAMALMTAFRRFDARSAILLNAALILGIAALVVAGMALLPSVLAFFGRNATLSGRTIVWQAVILSILKRPWFGYGFYAFWQGLTGESANTILAVSWTFGYAHNGILELLLQIGIAGTAVFFVTLIQACRDAWFCFRNGRPGGTDWYIGLIVLTILYNIDEATVVWPNELLSILYVVACCGLAKSARRLRRL